MATGTHCFCLLPVVSWLSICSAMNSLVIFQDDILTLRTTDSSAMFSHTTEDLDVGISSNAMETFRSRKMWAGLDPSPPRLLPQAFDLERIIPEGTNVQLPCPVEADPDTLFFEWLREKEPLDTFGEERYRVATSGILKIKAAIPEDSGLYICRAVNGFGRVEVNVTLIVLADDVDDVQYSGEDGKYEGPEGKTRSRERPYLVHVTKSNNGTLRRRIGSSVRLKCVAVGSPEPHVTWLRNGQPVADINLSPGSRRGRWSLDLRNLQEQDGGNYTCVTYNMYGHSNFTFYVQLVAGIRRKPELRGSHPINTTVDLGGMAVFQCRVKSDIPPHVQWLKQEDPDEAEAEGRKVIKVHGAYFRVIKSTEVSERSDGSFLNKLVVPDVTERDSGKYICLGANTEGYSFRSAFLTVLAKQQTYLAELEEEETALPVQFSPLFITIPVSLGVLVALLVALVVHCHRKSNQHVPRPASTTSSKAVKAVVATPGYPVNKDVLSTAGKISFHHALHSSEGTWSHAPSTVAMDTGHPDSFSECGSSFVFWGDPALYPDAVDKGGCLVPRMYSPNHPSHLLFERDYVRYLDNV